MPYGNGDSVSYTYDAFDRQRTAAYNDGTTYHYDYSSDNDLARQYVTDGSGAVTEQYSYQYDSLGRLIHSRQSTGGGTLVQLTQHMYDNANRLTSQSWQFGGDTFRQSYTYTGQNSDGKPVDGTLSAITTTIPGQSVITSTYGDNDLRQLTAKGVTVPDQNGKQTKVYDRSYTYDRIAEDDGCNWMGTRLASTGYTFGSSSRSFTYTYDAAGNISRIVTAGTNVPKAAQSKEYGYAAQGQLATEKHGSGTPFGYAYDTALCAEVVHPVGAEPAVAAVFGGIKGDAVAHGPALHGFAQLRNGAAGFVAHDQRRDAPPVLTAAAVHIAAADGAGLYLNQHLVRCRFRAGNIPIFKGMRCGEHQCFHHVYHSATLPSSCLQAGFFQL